MSSERAPAVSDDLVIAARDVGKCFHIYRRPQDRLKQALWGNHMSRKYYRDFWAVRDVTFEVRRGQGVGFIGRNGAGKSTLLQMITGTLTPSAGEIEVRGRIAAMLELGSGFNPEFTGRENVFLNGLILGVTRREMERRFDDIASFADIGDFMDQPLKTYSSGMRARLAFAVSTAIEPDILIVDEILSVGDVGFKQKCIARMKAMRDDGLTLLFVSHSAAAVKSLCDRAVFLHGGRVAFQGPSEATVNRYLQFIRETENDDRIEDDSDLGRRRSFENEVDGALRYGAGHAQFQEIRVLNSRGEPATLFSFGDMVTLEIRFKAHETLTDLSLSFLVRDQYGVDLLGTTTFDERIQLPSMAPDDEVVVRLSFESRLRKGHYGVCAALSRIKEGDRSQRILLDQVDGCAAFRVTPDESRPVHYVFHEPVSIEWEALTHDRCPSA